MARPFVTGYLGYFNPGQNTVIAAGDTSSAPINCGGMCLTGLILPSVFTGTAISFLVGDSLDGYQAAGEIIFTGTTTDGDTITIKGVAIEFVDLGPIGSQVLIGATAAETASNLYDFLVASVDPNLSLMTYALVDTVITVTAKVYGTGGNAYGFAASSSNITLSPSGGTLGGGGFRPLYNSSNSLVSMTVAQGRAYAVDPANFQGVLFLKIKSGSTELAARTLICSLKGLS